MPLLASCWEQNRLHMSTAPTWHCCNCHGSAALNKHARHIDILLRCLLYACAYAHYKLTAAVLAQVTALTRSWPLACSPLCTCRVSQHLQSCWSPMQPQSSSRRSQQQQPLLQQSRRNCQHGKRPCNSCRSLWSKPHSTACALILCWGLARMGKTLLSAKQWACLTRF